MAKSKIIKDFVSNKVSIDIALKQLKILLVDLGKDELIDWVDNELQGYSKEAEMPEYRVCYGILKGSFMNHPIRVSNAPIPLLNNVPQDIRTCCSSVEFREGVFALKELLDRLKQTNKNLIVQLSPNVLPIIQKHAAVSMTYLMSASIEISETDIINILSVIENKVLDILILLEKEFGCLDDLEIDISSKSIEEVTRIEQNIYLILFDNGIRIGDNNRISGSRIETTVEKEL